MNIIFLPQRPYKQLTVLNLMCSHQSILQLIIRTLLSPCLSVKSTRETITFSIIQLFWHDKNSASFPRSVKNQHVGKPLSHAAIGPSWAKSASQWPDSDCQSHWSIINKHLMYLKNRLWAYNLYHTDELCYSSHLHHKVNRFLMIDSLVM